MSSEVRWPNATLSDVNETDARDDAFPACGGALGGLPLRHRRLSSRIIAEKAGRKWNGASEQFIINEMKKTGKKTTLHFYQGDDNVFHMENPSKYLQIRTKDYLNTLDIERTFLSPKFSSRGRKVGSFAHPVPLPCQRAPGMNRRMHGPFKEDLEQRENAIPHLHVMQGDTF